MDKRIPSNSFSLHAEFPKEYHHLYYSSEIVTSAAGSFYWSGEHIVLYGAPIVLQKLPLRAFVGLQRSHEPGVRFGPWSIYTSAAQQFEKGQIPESQKYAMAKVLEPLLPKFINQPGLEVDSLFEMHPAVGLNSSGALSAAIATGLFILGDRLTPQEVGEWQRQPLKSILQNETFDQVFRLAWKLDAAISGGYSSGSAAFTSLVSSRYPVVYWSAGRSEEDGYPRFPSYPAYVGENWDLLDNIPIFAARLDELYDIPAGKELPIDYGLIFSGRTRYTQAATADISMKRRRNLDQFAASLASLSSIHLQSLSIPSALSLVLPDARDAWWKSVLVLGSALVASVIEGLRDSLVAAEPDRLDRLVDLINHYNKFLYYVGAGNQFLEAETAEVRWYIENRWHSNVGVKIIGAGQGGDLLFVFPHAFEYSNPDDLVEYLQQKFSNPKIHVDYMSWIDGAGEQSGVVVDYSRKFEIVPPNLQGLYRLHMYGRRKGVTLVPYSTIDDRAREFDLAIIGVQRKKSILIGGQEAKFKMGKQTAVDIFRRILIENQPVLSTEMGVYGKKAEFAASLINPLDEMLRRERGREFPFFVKEKAPQDGGGFEVFFREDPELTIGLFLQLEPE
jgi:hypothetical protein